MNSHLFTQREPTPLETQLTAYLDGELDPQQRAEVEELLATDPAAQTQLETLQQAWDELEHLPPAQVDADFAQSTIKMIALAAQRDATGDDDTRRVRSRRWAVWSLAVLATGTLTYLIGALLFAQPNEQLLSDLPVLQRLDHYTRVENIDQLRTLFESGEFASGETLHAGNTDIDEMIDGDGDAGADVISWAPAFGDDPRATFSSMADAERVELRRRWERFGRMPPEEQARLRRLHEQLAADPLRDELWGLLVRYAAWLDTLSPGEQVALAELTEPAEWLAEVKQQRQRDPARAVQVLTSSDYRVMADWLQTTAEEKMPQLAKLEHLPGSDRRAHVANTMLRFWQHGGARRTAIIGEEEIADLYDRLSPAAQAQLDQLDDLRQKRRLIFAWSTRVVQRQLGRNVRAPVAMAADQWEKLTAFVEQLPQQERERLEQLAPSERRREIWRRYSRSNITSGEQPGVQAFRARNQRMPIFDPRVQMPNESR